MAEPERLDRQRDTTMADRITSSFDLALGTWFYKFLVDETPGGLPADLFTQGAAALLICDRIWCDRDSFEAEMTFASSRRGRHAWLSCEFYRELFDAGILVPICYGELLADALSEDRAGSLGGQVNDAMARMRGRLMSDPSALWEPLDPVLAGVDRLYLARLSEKGLVPYDWAEGLLPRLGAEAVQSATGVGPRAALSVIAMELPHCPVLPSPNYVREVDRDAFNGFEANIRKERLPLSRWMYGDPEWTRERYQDFRAGADFRAADAAFDRARERHARAAFERLMQIRDDTASVRPEIQRHFAVAVERFAAGASEAELRDDARAHELAFHELLPAADRRSLRLGVCSAGMLADIAATLSGGLELGAVGAALSIAGFADLVRTARARLRAREEEPLGYLFSEVRKTRGGARDGRR
jgi:hypothetical protein